MPPHFEHDDSLTFPSIKQVNLPTGRVYQLATGAVFPSITRVLAKKEKPQLQAWKERVGKEEASRVSARATAQGSSLHKLAECFLDNQELPRHMPNVAELWSKLRPWLDDHVTKVYAQEQSVYSQKLGVAGRLDLLVDIDGIFSISDVKTSKSEREPRDYVIHDYFLQGTFYALAVFELTGRAPRQIVLPITTPDKLYVYTSNPRKHTDELFERVEHFYADFLVESLDDETPHGDVSA